jgi:formyltetrahydrofolate deformylase
VAGFIAEHDGNILEADQHTDPEHGEFFMRVEIELTEFGLTRADFRDAYKPIAERFDMRWRVFWGDQVKRMAVLVGKESHCLNDLLWRWKTGELPVEIPLVASNHDDLRQSVEAVGVAFHHLPIAPDERAAQEGRFRSLLDDARIDFLVLARYMRILSPSFVAAYRERIINIHHSFLPAFAGPKPYHQAYERGVKIIGATSHYVTDALDSGPIIAQGTLPVDHRDTVRDLIRKGRDLERIVLATAVRHHVEDKVLVSQNKTVVFD